MTALLRSVTGKLALLLLALFVTFGVLNGVLSLVTARAFVKEVNQKVNHDLARQLAGNRDLMRDGRVNQAAAKALFDGAMDINPLAEVYVLGLDGTILAPSPSATIKRTRVAMEPITRVMAGEPLPIVGDDPRDPTGRRVFSVAPLGRVGYLYVILGGQQFESLLDMVLQSQMLRSGLWVLLGSLAFGAAAGLFLVTVSTRRVRALTVAMQAFRASDYSGEAAAVSRRTRYEDEVDRLSETFAEMASRIRGQIEQLRETDAARRALFANVSHDLRTPLASLQAYLETLLMKGDGLAATEQRHYLEGAVRRGHQLTQLVSQLFDLAKLESSGTRLVAEPLAACDLVQDVAQKHQLVATAKNVTIAVDLLNTESLIQGDVGLLERMLDNLLENAVRFTPPGAVVRVQCDGSAPWASIKVIDGGPGIPPQELDHIFDRFYRGRQTASASDHTGLGLGLAIAKRIVELHGGTIGAANGPGAGAIFDVRLPTDRTSSP